MSATVEVTYQRAVNTPHGQQSARPEELALSDWLCVNLWTTQTNLDSEIWLNFAGEDQKGRKVEILAPGEASDLFVIDGVRASKTWKGIPLFTEEDRAKITNWPYAPEPGYEDE